MTRPTRQEWDSFERLSLVCFAIFACSVVCIANGMGDAFTGEQQMARHAIMTVVWFPAMVGLIAVPVVWTGRLLTLFVRWFLR